MNVVVYIIVYIENIKLMFVTVRFIHLLLLLLLLMFPSVSQIVTKETTKKKHTIDRSTNLINRYSRIRPPPLRGLPHLILNCALRDYT